MLTTPIDGIFIPIHGYSTDMDGIFSRNIYSTWHPVSSEWRTYEPSCSIKFHNWELSSVYCQELCQMHYLWCYSYSQMLWYLPLITRQTSRQWTSALSVENDYEHPRAEDTKWNLDYELDTFWSYISHFSPPVKQFKYFDTDIWCTLFRLWCLLGWWFICFVTATFVYTMLWMWCIICRAVVVAPSCCISIYIILPLPLSLGLFCAEVGAGWVM